MIALLVLALISQAPSAYADVDPLAAPADMLSLRDPFRRPNVDAASDRPKSDLETFPADQLKMIGVLTGPKRLKGMILAPNGKTYFVTLNTRVGLRNGVITRITENAMLIREKVVNLLGQQEDLETTLKLVAEQRSFSENEGYRGGMRGGPGLRSRVDMEFLKRAAQERNAGGGVPGGIPGGIPGGMPGGTTANGAPSNGAPMSDIPGGGPSH